MAASPRRRIASPFRAGHRARVAVLALLIGVLGLAGCSAGGEAPTSADAGGGDMAGGPAAPPVVGEEAAEGDGAGEAGAPPAPADERALIYTGTITVEVDSVAQAADEATAVAIGVGGIVAGDNRTIEEDRSQATLVLRVPAEQFMSTLDRLARLGTEQSRQLQAQDVTEQLVDLDARIATQQASVDRIRELLARAQTIAEIVSLESELTRRQADLDSLIQRRATMAGLVDLATITLVLHEPSGPIEEEETETGFVAGLRQGWDGFLVSVEVVLTLCGFLLPWAIAFGGPALLITWLVRRRRRRSTATPSAPTPPLPPAPPITK